MIKQYKTAFIFLGIIVILVAGVIGMQYLNPAETEPQSTIVPREQKEIFAIARENIKTLAISNPDDA